MTYIDYINQFNRWKDNNTPSDKAIILYFALLDIFNQRGWPRLAVIDTPRLMSMACTSNRNTALRAREELLSAGLIAYTPGKKGKASEYRLLRLKKSTVKDTEKDTEYCIYFDTVCDTEKGKGTELSTGKGINFDTQYVTQSDTPNKTIDKDLDIDIINDVVNNDLARVMSAFLNKINPTPSQMCLDELKGYVEVMGADCCLRAFDIALDNKKTTWPYIRAILRSKQSQGVRCLADWDELEEKRKAQILRDDDEYSDVI